jgi:hypothetical protein
METSDYACDRAARNWSLSSKDLSVENLDRYRWKVNEAMQDLNKSLANHSQNIVKSMDRGCECNPYLELAIAAEQASRRINKLRDACWAITDVMTQTLDWLDDCEEGVRGQKNLLREQMTVSEQPGARRIKARSRALQSLVLCQRPAETDRLEWGEG